MKERLVDPNSEQTHKISIPCSLPGKFFEDIFKRTQEMNSVLYVSTLPSAISDNEKSLYRRLVQPQASNSQYLLRNLLSLSPPKNVNTRRIVKDNLSKRIRKEEKKLSREMINRIIFSDKGHIVSTFKDYLIFDEHKEQLKRFIRLKYSLSKLRELSKNAKDLAPFRFHWKEYKALEKAESLKSRMQKFRTRTDRKEFKEISTLFISSFRYNLAREDLSSSWSILPTSSLMSSLSHDSRKIEDLLKELEQDNSPIHKSKIEEYKTTPKKSVLDNYLTKARIFVGIDDKLKIPVEGVNIESRNIKNPSQIISPLAKHSKKKAIVENVAHTLKQETRTSIEAYRTIIKPRLLGENKTTRGKVQIKQVFLSKEAFNKKLRRNNKRSIKI
jgi:hypothetical protein